MYEASLGTLERVSRHGEPRGDVCVGVDRVFTNVVGPWVLQVCRDGDVLRGQVVPGRVSKKRARPPRDGRREGDWDARGVCL